MKGMTEKDHERILGMMEIIEGIIVVVGTHWIYLLKIITLYSLA